MAKKSKRSRGGSPKSKKNRPSGAPLRQSSGTGSSSLGSTSSSGGASANGARALATNEPLAVEQRDSSAPESQRRTRAAGGILPPPHDEAPSDPSFDEISIPPVTSSSFGDTNESRELEDSFFVRRVAVDAHAHAAHHDHDEVEAQVDPRTAQKRTAAAQARRAHLTRYVKWTVGVAAGLLALGVGRAAFKGKPDFGTPPPIIHTAMAAVAVDNTPHDIAPRDPTAPATAAPTEESQEAADRAVAALEQGAAAPPQNAAQDTTPPVANDAVQAPAAPASTPDTNSAQKSADPAAQAAAPAPQAAAPTPAADPAPAAAAPSDKTAAQEKKASSQLLERGNAKGAIEAGERSVALDSTDGEAWLVLGAAYQQVGKNADARRCFNACVKEGKHGPIGECREMLQ